MITVKRVIWPTDFSEHSLAALKVANDFALRFGSRLALIHVIADMPYIPVAASTVPGVVASTPPQGFDIESFMETQKKNAKHALDDIVANRVSKDLETSIHIPRGNSADEIIGLADDAESDLIVIAKHGTSGFKRFLYGSIAEKVVRLSTCPVLTIHTEEEEG